MSGVILVLGIELPEEITVEEIIDKTDGQFGSQQYREFFEGRAASH